MALAWLIFGRFAVNDSKHIAALEASQKMIMWVQHVLFVSKLLFVHTYWFIPFQKA